MLMPPQGPYNANILLLFPHPTANCLATGMYFGKGSSQTNLELARMLNEIGVLVSDCYATSIIKTNFSTTDFLVPHKTKIIPTKEMERLIEEIWLEIDRVKPNVVIAFGQLVLWALTGETKLSKWRGSVIVRRGIKIIPTYHPSDIMRMWSWRWISKLDLNRAKKESVVPELESLPDYDFAIRPDFESAKAYLCFLIGLPAGSKIACDIETRGGHIACVGFAWSRTKAICIPLMCVERPEGYWSFTEEFELWLLLIRLLARRDIRWVLQNGSYDNQYFARYMGVMPDIYMDTMVAHHVCWAGLPKGLDFLSSMYCDYHLYWKDEGKNWNPRHMGEDTLWTYNCKDACITFEVSDDLDINIRRMGLERQVEFQMRLLPCVIRMMLRGVRQNIGVKNKLNLELFDKEFQIAHWIETVVGFPLNPKSPKQMAQYFYGDLKLPVQKNRKTGQPTCDEIALQKLGNIELLVKPLVKKITDLRSIAVFRSTFVAMPLGPDKRMRSSYNIAGPVTYRFSSSEDAFGQGGNLQNIPEGDEKDDLPNIRKIFLPDLGYTILEVDLKGADAQVVAWEADDAELKAMFREGANVHEENAKVIFGNVGITKESDPFRYRQTKVGVHATNYVAKPPEVARALGITVHEADTFQKRWFGAHPGIKDWHRRVENDLATTRTVTNRFGFRRYFFDRIETILPEAVAWGPQSTVALIINNGLVNVDETLSPAVELLLQVHDSLVMQVPTHLLNRYLPLIRQCITTVVPYPDPLIINASVKASTVSWGDCKDIKWPASEIDYDKVGFNRVNEGVRTTSYRYRAG